MMSYIYLAHGDMTLRTRNDGINKYGVGFELPLIFIEKGLGLNNDRSIYYMRHLAGHLFFLFAAFLFFFLIDYLYKNKLLAALGFLLLVANPLIYSHSFYDSKDVPFLSMYVICYYLAALAFTKNNLRYYILLGAACGLLTNFRIMGVLLIACIGFFFLLDYLQNKGDKPKRKEIRKFFWVFFLTALAVLYISWPYLYNNPVQNFTDAFKDMSRHQWEGVVLFDGQNIKSTEIPTWKYAAVWIAITTPPVYLLLRLTGIVILAMHFFRKPKPFFTNQPERNNLLYVVGFFQPLVSVIIFHSVIFDS